MSNCCALIIDNREGLEPIIEMHEKYIPKDWDVLWVKSEDTTTAHGYNKLMVSKRLWRNLPEWVLIFQSDSMLLKTGVEDFVGWDFIGSPIPKIGWPAMNGGLSLRSSKAMLKVINQIAWSPQLGNEDIYFCNALKHMHGNLPNYETAKRFSCESEYVKGSVGYHAIDKWLTPSECESIRNQYNKVSA